MNLYLRYFLHKDRSKDLKELDASNSVIHKALQLLEKNIKYFQNFRINLKNQYLGIFTIFVKKNWIHEKLFQQRIDEYCEKFSNSYYFVKELHDVLNNEEILKEVYKRLFKDKKTSIFYELNMHILKKHLGKYESNIETFKYLINKYIDNFKSDLEL